MKTNERKESEIRAAFFHMIEKHKICPTPEDLKVLLQKQHPDCSPSFLAEMGSDLQNLTKILNPDNGLMSQLSPLTEGCVIDVCKYTKPNSVERQRNLQLMIIILEKANGSVHQEILDVFQDFFSGKTSRQAPLSQGLYLPRGTVGSGVEQKDTTVG